MKVRAEHHAGRHARDRGHRESRHDDARCGAAPFDGDDVGDDRHDARTEDAARDAGERTARQQQRIAGCAGADHVRYREQQIRGEEQLTAIEAIDIGGGQQGREPRAPRVGRHSRRELGRRDVEGGHDLWPERHHHHEIHDERELHEREQPYQTPLARLRHGIHRCSNPCRRAVGRTAA
jgi:hypothetical protein